MATITAPSGTALKTRLLKLAEQYPNECSFIENADGSVLGHVPVKYIKLNPPRSLGEEERLRRSELFKEMRSNSAFNVLDDDLDLEE